MSANSATVSTAAPIAATGQSQWTLIWREFRKRRLAVFAAGVILVLFTVSIFAPLIASATPLRYSGINRFEYQEAARTLRAATNQLIEARANKKSKIDETPYLKTIPLQVQLMARQLPADKATAVLAIGQQILAAAKSTDTAGSIDELKRLLREVRSGFDAKEVTLVARPHWPVFESLNGLDVGFLIANCLLLSSPIWMWGVRRMTPAGRQRIRFWCLTGVQIGLPVLVGGAWWYLVPSRVDRTDYKSAVFAAEDEGGKAPVVFESVTWPIIAYGLDEHDLDRVSATPQIYRWLNPQLEKQGAAATLPRWSGPHFLGTDDEGRDVLCRLIWGGRVSLSVGLVAVGIYVSIGIAVGALAGYFRGICDLIISRVIEVMICFPTFFLILTIVAFFGPSITHIMVIIGLTGWTGVARLVRGEFLRLVDQEFVLAGRALGYSPARIIFRHVLPNAMAPVLVSATFGIAGAILTESALSFLGLGISKPTPSWGGLLADGRNSLQHAPWLIHFPGLAIFVTITAYNLTGEALRDASDPRLRGSR